MKKKRLLILGGAIQCKKVIDAAEELGVYTIVTDINPNKNAVSNADEVLYYSVMDYDSLIEWCKKNPVDGVLNFCVDYAQHTHQKLCAELGLPCFGTEEQYHILTDKTAFKKFCQKCGVDTIPEYSESEIESIEYPVLVKPAESSGSRGTKKCDSKDELITALKEAKTESRSGKAIIEKYMGDKPDFSCAYIVIDEVPYLSRTLDRHLGREDDNLHRQCICARHCSKYTDLFLEKVNDKIKNMLINLGLRNSPVFMQGFIDGDKIRFYDPGIRFSGAEYERLVKKATGIDIVKHFIRYALGDTLYELSTQIESVYKLNGYCGLLLFLDSYPGKIQSIEGIDEVAGLPFVEAVQQKHFAGETIPDSGDVKQRVMEIAVVVEDNREAISGAIHKIEHLISIKDENGKEMLTPLVDPDLLVNQMDQSAHG